MEEKQDKKSKNTEWKFEGWKKSKVYDKNAELKTIIRELATYILFLCILLIVAFAEKGEKRYYFTKAMEDIFINTPAPTNGRSFTEMTIISDFWEFAETVMIDGFFWETWYKSKDKTHKETTEDDHKILYENRLLGLPRIRQVRVRSNSCTVYEKFHRTFSTCYAPYSSDTEDQSSFGPSEGTAWVYHSQEVVGSHSHSGQISSYSGGGYFEDLPTETKENMASAVAVLKENLWIGRGTRAVFIDFTVYNANVNLFCIVKLVMEIPPTGGVIPSWRFNTVKLLRYITGFDYFVMGCEWMVMAFITYYVIEEIFELIRGKLQYLHDGWNIFDLIIIVLSLICMGISIYRRIVVDQKVNRVDAYGSEYANFETLGVWETHFNNMIAVVVFFVWIKLFKFVKFNKTMNQLSMTLKRCSKDVVGFSVMFFIVFLAYAQLGHLIFGDQLEAFNNIVRSSFTLLRTILGDFDYDSIEAVDRIIAPIFFLTFIFIVFFILLNVFIAIISDTYSEVKAETEKVDIYHLGKFCCQGCRNILVRLNILKPRKHDDFRDWRLTGKKIRGLLLRSDFTNEEASRFLEKYNIVDEDEVIKPEEARRILNDMDGKTNEQIMREIAGTQEFSVADYNELKKRVESIEESLRDLIPKFTELMRTIEEA